MDPSQTEVRVKRFKVIWRALIVSNLALGAYLFSTSVKKKDKSIKGKRTEMVRSTPPDEKQKWPSLEDQRSEFVDHQSTSVKVMPVAEEQMHQPVLKDQQSDPAF